MKRDEKYPSLSLSLISLTIVSPTKARTASVHLGSASNSSIAPGLSCLAAPFCPFQGLQSQTRSLSLSSRAVCPNPLSDASLTSSHNTRVSFCIR